MGLEIGLQLVALFGKVVKTFRRWTFAGEKYVTGCFEVL